METSPFQFYFSLEKRKKLLSKLVPHSMYESGRVPSLNWFPMTRGYQSNRVSKQSLQSMEKIQQQWKRLSKDWGLTKKEESGTMTLILIQCNVGHTIPHICHRHHRRCLCKKKLPGVIFHRFNAKNWQFTVYLLCNAQ